MCVNADESEPATFNNRILMELDPHQVIEGIIIGCYATRATTAYIYVRCEYPTAFQRAAGRRSTKCYAKKPAGEENPGERIPRSTSTCTAGRRRTSAAKKTGPDRKPRREARLAAHQALRSPAIEGAFRKPTVVNNIETMANVPPHHQSRCRLVQIDGDSVDRPKGSPAATGPSCTASAGTSINPGCHEMPLGGDVPRN